MNNKRKVKVLIADDERDIRNLIKVALKDMNCEIVAEAENGIEAIELFKKHLPHLTIMDINMPVMDGKEALKAIKSEFPLAFVIMLSGVSSMDTVKEALELGAANYIRKDIPLVEIKKEIEKAWKDFKREFWTKMLDWEKYIETLNRHERKDK